jgi:hypothetical protein
VGKKEVFGHKYGLYQTKQTFNVDLGFLRVHSDEDHQRQVSVWLVLVAERCTQIIAWCAFAIKLF